MTKVETLINLAVNIGKYNISNRENYFDENYMSLDIYKEMTEEEKQICDVLYGNSDNLTKIILTKEEVLEYIKECMKFNGYYKAELDENQLEEFLDKVLFKANAIFEILDLEIDQISYDKFKFNGYNKNFYSEYYFNHKPLLKNIAVIELGEGMYIALPLMDSDFLSNDYLRQNVLGMILKTEYILDSDKFFEIYEAYDGYRKSHGYNKTRIYEKNKEKDEVFKFRFEKSMNTVFKLHLRINEVTSEYSAADKEEVLIYEASKNYNPAIQKIYDLYNDISEQYRPYMTEADYLILDWMRFCIAVHKKDEALAEVLGLNILKRKSAFEKLPKTFYQYTNYVLPLHGSKGELLRDFSNYYLDEIVFQLLNYYVKSCRYDDAYAILKYYDFYFSRYLDDKNDAKIRESKLKQLLQDAQWDIGLIVADRECTFNEHILEEWSKKIEQVTFAFKKSKLNKDDYGRYKKMSQYISNVIIIMLTKEDYNTATTLLNIYNEYLIKDEEYEALEKFVIRESDLKSNNEMLENLLGLFSSEVEETHKFLNSFYKLTDSEMNSDISFTDSENEVIKILSNESGYEYEGCIELIKKAQKKYVNIKNENIENQNFEYDFYIGYFDNALNILTELTKNSQEYDDVETILKDDYSQSIWDKFSDDTKKYLVTGSVLYNYLVNKNDNEKFDYSPICLCWAKAVENEFQKKFYSPLVRAYNNSLRSGEVKYPQSSFEMRRNKKRDNSNEVDIKNFTLGSLVYVCGINKEGELRDREDWDRFNQFLQDYVYKTMNDDSERKEHIKNLVNKSEKLNTDYRIKATHPLETINKTELEGCKDIVFQSQELLKLIVKDMDEDWPKKSMSFN